jgi:hypothetical protein
LQNLPFSLVKRRDGKATLGGFVGRVWAIMERRMNFT